MKSKYILQKLGEALYKRKERRKQAQKAKEAVEYLAGKQCIK